MRIAVSMDFSAEIGFFLKADLIERLQSLGFEILPLLYDDKNLELKLKTVQGVLIPGGLGDVDPALFGESKKFDSVKVIRNRCDFEFKLLKETFKQDLPFFGICWGIQVLNVYLGGSLIQDIRSERADCLLHEKCEKDENPMHEIVFADAAAKLIGRTKIKVNSTHHQAVAKLADSLENQGTSSDGLIECVKVKDKKFAWAVQWHPERLNDDLFIHAFQEACRR